MAVDFGMVNDIDEVKDLVEQLKTCEDGFGFDIETGYAGPPREKHSLHPETAFVVGVSFSGDPSWARYVPLRHDTGPNLADETAFARLLAPLLGSGLGVPYNAKFELRHLARFLRERLTPAELSNAGLAPDGYYPLYDDPMITAFLLGRFRTHGLKAVTHEVFRHRMIELDELFTFSSKKARQAMRFNELDLRPAVVSYACEDAAWALALSHKHLPLVRDRLLYQVEMALIPILARMEDRGVSFDWPSMAREAARVDNFAEAYRAEIMRDLTARLGTTTEVNLSSPPQVQDLLYNRLGLSTTRMTKAGKMSSDAKAVAGLAKRDPTVQKILNWRELTKLHGSYLIKYDRDFNYAADGRTHPSHAQTQIVSGRFAVTEPAYQQLPKRYFYKLAEDDTANSGAEYRLNFRDFVVAAPEHYLIGFDYSQIELRVLAGLSGEPALVKAYRDGVDVHQLTASMLFDIPFDSVGDAERAVGKTTNFAIVYGQGAKGMAERLGISLEQAKEFIERYFTIYGSIRSWVSRQTEQGVAQGVTYSRFGRVHPIWQLESPNRGVRATGERLCVNAPIQGGAADLMKVAMVRTDRRITAAPEAERIHMIMNIHDALVFEVHSSVPPQRVIDLVAPEVCLDVPGWPPVIADWEIGRRWGSMTKLVVDNTTHRIDLTATQAAQVKAAAKAAPVEKDPAFEDDDLYPVDETYDEYDAA